MRKAAQATRCAGTEQNPWLVEFNGAAQTRKWLDQEAAALRLIMTEVGLVTQ